jgi:hypothetical protein
MKLNTFRQKRARSGSVLHLNWYDRGRFLSTEFQIHSGDHPCRIIDIHIRSATIRFWTLLFEDLSRTKKISLKYTYTSPSILRTVMVGLLYFSITSLTVVHIDADDIIGHSSWLFYPSADFWKSSKQSEKKVVQENQRYSFIARFSGDFLVEHDLRCFWPDFAPLELRLALQHALQACIRSYVVQPFFFPRMHLLSWFSFDELK